MVYVVSTRMPNQNKEPAWKGFVVGGLSSMIASSITHPIDLVKVHMQLQGELLSKTQNHKNSLKTGYLVFKEGGTLALYRGLSASLARQGTYSTTRFGIYEFIKQKTNAEGNKPSLVLNIAGAAFAGAVGSALGSPCDLILVRMQADGVKPLEQRRNYRNIFHGLYSVYKYENGVFGLWKGSGPVIMRAILVTASQLATYDSAKDYFQSTGYLNNNILTSFLASLVAGFIAAASTSPVDVIKTRIMNDKKRIIYKNSFDCFIKILKTEGLIGFYKGFIPNYIRLGPHTTITLVVLEELRKIFYKQPSNNKNKINI